MILRPITYYRITKNNTPLPRRILNRIPRLPAFIARRTSSTRFTG